MGKGIGLAGGLVRLCVVAAGATFPAPALHAQQPAAEIVAPRFDIVRYEVEGNTLLTPAQVDGALAGHTGKQKDFGDIQRALEALEHAYRGAGWGVVQVTLPEQDITRGVVRFRVVEARLGKVVIEGNQHFSTENVRRSVPALKEGTTPNSRAIARNLQVAAENPAKQTTALLRSGEKDGEVDAVVKVADEKPWKLSATLDNTGTSQTGDYRLGVGLLHANVLGRDHVLTAQYITSPGHWNDVKIYGLGYRIPFYSLGSSLDLVGGYSDVDSGTVGSLFTVTGAGTIGAVRYNQHLQRLTDYEHKIVFGYDYRAYQNQVIAQGTNVVPDITVHPVSAYYAGIYRTEGSEFNFYGYIAQNIDPHGNDANDAVFKQTRVEAKAAYRLYRYQAVYSRLLPREWQFRALVNGQYTQDALIPAEQYGIGGMDSVRGFLERQVVNDYGYRGTVEFYTPDFADRLKLREARVRALAFVDAGTVRRNKSLPGEIDNQTISSFGFGLRIAYGKSLSARFDFAQIADGGGVEGSGDRRLQFSMSVIH